mgnify:CR=1 FL=1
MNRLQKRIAIVILAIVAGGALGGTASHQISGEKMDERQYCQTVEEGIQSNMSQGFINCYPPGVLNVNLSQQVEENSQTRCTCRRKIGQSVQTITFTTSN